MFGIAAIVAAALAWILWLASVHQGVFLTWQSFTLLGLLLFYVHVVTQWWPARHGPPA